MAAASAAIRVKSAETTDVNSPLFQQMKKRVDRAVRDRDRHRIRINDVYRYTMPWRHKTDISNFATGFGSENNVPDLDLIFDELPAMVLEDFAADMLNTFTPQKNNWLTEKPVETLDAGDQNRIRDDLGKRTRFVFAEMARSNLYQALQEAYLDLGPGTMVLLVTDPDGSKPLHVDAIPITEALITRGPYGYTDGVFRRKMYFMEECKELWPDGDWQRLPQPSGNDNNHQYKVTDGCWRDWSDRGNEKYHYVVECENIIIYKKEYIGAGSCPFICARWTRDSTTAWGVGPTYRTLPAIKTINHFSYLGLKNYDKIVDPAGTYEDDGVLNFDNGIIPGRMHPRAPGSQPPEIIESKGRVDYEAFQIDEKRSIIKRAHYQDRPEQTGKTPPTAFQWADERAERARRMGSPATNLVMELQIPLYLRFVYLLNERGVLPQVTMDGRVVALEPVSPLLRAQEQEEVIRLDRFAEMITARFGPQIAMIVIDVVKYSSRLAELLGVPKELLREEKGIVAAIQQLMPILQNFAGGGGGAPALAAPAPQGLVTGAQVQ
jgi:head-to-tail connecting protein